MLKQVLELSHSAETASDYETALSMLEEAHILSQPFFKEHFYVHWKMLCLALKYRQWEEIIGQIPRIILAIPGSLFGLAPKGNVGSTKMGIFEKAE